MRPRNRLGSRRGATLVEFATVLPVTLLMGIGAFDIGTLLIERQRVVQATFEATRYAAQGAAVVTDAQVQARAAAALEAFGVDTEGLQVSVDRYVADSDPVVTVQLQLPVHVVAGLLDLPTTHTESFTLLDQGA
ncbi:MAG: hypothetical protein D6798_02305 [Deltaproteobacteria bacterium]|nr:MAG: hypothetical protein D6798_02305 [Deltaproteobacteria bacterium]